MNEPRLPRFRPACRATVDECKEWADKAAALASYHKQSQDTALEQLCNRIRARAVQRIGRELESGSGVGGGRKTWGGHPL